MSAPCQWCQLEVCACDVMWEKSGVASEVSAPDIVRELRNGERLCHRAAAEIERLREDINREHNAGMGYAKRALDAEKKLNKAREGLERIVNIPYAGAAVKRVARLTLKELE